MTPSPLQHSALLILTPWCVVFACSLNRAEPTPPDTAADSADDSEGGDTDTGTPDGGEDSGGGDTDTAATPEAVTWSNSIADLAQQNCVRCHALGRFSTYEPLQTYAQFSGIVEKIVGKIQSPPSFGTQMPPSPWGEIAGICEPEYPFSNDLRMSAEEVQTILDWAANGVPEGTPRADEPLLADPRPELTGVTEYPFDEGYVMSIDEFDDDGHRDDWVCVILDDGASPDSRFMSGIQLNPDVTQVFRGAVLWLDEARESLAYVDGSMPRDHGTSWYDCDEGFGFSGRILAGFLPEGQPIETPPGSAVEIPGGTAIVAKIHYHGHYDHENPTDTGALPSVLNWEDHTSFSIRWDDPATVTSVAELVTFGDYDDVIVNGEGNLDPPFAIPAGSTSHTESMVTTVPGDPTQAYQVWAVQAQLGNAGRTVAVSVGYQQTRTTACLGAVPRWGVSWQVPLTYDTTVGATTVNGGDRLRVDCTYANDGGSDLTLATESCRAMVGIVPVP
jgi:hypothetical protein